MCQRLVHCAPLVLLLTKKTRKLQPCPSKAVMWTPAFCLIYILRHSPSIPPPLLPHCAAPCQHHHPTTPTGFIKNAEFKLISDIWPFVRVFFLSNLSFCRGSKNTFHQHEELQKFHVRDTEFISTSTSMLIRANYTIKLYIAISLRKLYLYLFTALSKKDNICRDDNECIMW